MPGRVAGSLGTSTRYAARWSAVSGKGLAPSRDGRVPRPGTRTCAGSQSSGWDAGKAARSSIGLPVAGLRLKSSRWSFSSPPRESTASASLVEEALDGPSLDLPPRAGPGRAERDPDGGPVGADG